MRGKAVKTAGLETYTNRRGGKRLPVALRQIGTTGNIPLHWDPKSMA